MTERTVQVVNPLGLHARPAAQLVRLASGYQAHVQLERDGMVVNGKSIMGVMMLAAECGSSLVIRADGGDESAAVDAIVALVGRGFDET
ncbi:MAG: HPr family phosphocarrier protein [Gemmatimonadales bacterium]